ncbi:transcriptional adapter 1-like [Haliotis asinina]|uniref:transcriptional adapter 1-like n=1 Tax=Haliotis asinina TaxID=109174 RepID=UPI0035322629
MAAPLDLNVARKNLSDALGDSMKLYLHNLKSWFKQKISKEDFDLEARNLLREDAVHLHNEFLLAIIARCQVSSSTTVSKEKCLSSSTSTPSKLKKGKIKRKIPGGRANLQQRFVPVNPTTHAHKVTTRSVDDGVTPLGFMSRDCLLPDISLMHGRMLVCAWESDLQDVASLTVKLLIQAVETQLKNIISLVLARRSGFKLREKKFRYGMGAQIPNPYLRQTQLMDQTTSESYATAITPTGHHAPSIKSSLDVGEEVAVHHLATSHQPAEDMGPISLYDLLDTLKLYRSSIPSHSVYAPAVERILHRLWHPSIEEVEQESIHQQEVYLKQQLASQQLPVR